MNSRPSLRPLKRRWGYRLLPVVQLDNKGLYTYPNQLSQVPQGAMAIANNVVCDRPGVAETRRGFDFYGDLLPSAGVKGFVYMSRLLWYCTAGELVYDSDAAGTWATYAGTFFPPSGNFINSTQSNGNFYFTTNNGVYKIAGLTGTPQQSGSPAALDLSVVSAGVGSAVVNNSQVAYSVVWGYIDGNDNLILGAPSSWAYLTNTSGSTIDVTITVTLPATITTNFFLQVYRTPCTASSSTIPGNNFQLAIVYNPDAADITAKSATITDSVPDALLGAYLYTADGQPNPYPNTQPPLCQDLCTFNGMTFYINWQTLQQANVTLISVGAALGVQIGDTFSLTDVDSTTTYTYTGAAANSAAAREFAIYTAGTIAQDIDTTARNLASMINQDPNNTLFYAYYQTGTNILPGSIIITTRDLQQGIFYANSSRQTCWSPEIPAAGATYTSANLSQPGHFLASKIGQPEAVPLLFDVPVATGNISVILYRGLALQDAAYLFSNAGVFRVTGTDPLSLQVVLFDSSALIVGLQTPAILNNSIFYYSTQGACSVSSGGNQIVSRNIERDLIQLSALSNFATLSYGCAYESDRKFLLFTPTSGADTSAQQEYIYNWITQAWTLWTRACSAAIVNVSANKLYVTDDVGNVFEERKNYNNTDYADEEYAITIVSTDTALDTLTLADSTDVQIGDTIQQTVLGTQYTTQVTGNDSGTGVVNVEDADGFTAGAAQDFRAIVTTIRYCPITCGFPQFNKKFSIWDFDFENANFDELSVNFTTDYYVFPEEQILSPQQGFGWGTQPWGTFVWGVTASLQQVIPCWPTTNSQWAHWVIIEMELQQAFTSLTLNGITGTFDVGSTRGR
jgi:hypothetical protein